MYIPFPDTDIYALTDSRQCLGRGTIVVVEAMLRAGVKLLQYREKDKSRKEMLRECHVLRRMTRDAGCCFIVNDYVDIALLCDADGVHVGQDDIPLADVRRLVGPDRIVGVSTHALPEALAAAGGGADYIGVGPLYATNTKKSTAPVGLAYLRDVVERCRIPFTAIGGVNRQTLPAVLAAGARCCAIVSDITTAEDIEARIRELRAIIATTKQA